MLGFIKGAINVVGAAQHVSKVVPVVKAVSSAWGDIEVLFDSFQEKRDSDKDGVSDWTTQEVLEFATEVINAVLKHAK